MKTGEPSWFYRRAMAFGIVGFCAFAILSGSPASDTTLNRAIVDGAFWLIGAIFLLYGGFATVQDVIAIWKTGSARPYAEPVEGTVQTSVVETKTVTQPDPQE